MKIVFLHGWGMNKGIWKPFIDYLQNLIPSNVEIFAIDWFPYQKNPAQTSVSDALDSIVREISTHLESDTILVGWSMGGIIAQHMADTGTRHLIGQIQICSSPKFEANQSWEGIRPDVLQMFAKQLSTDHESLLKRFIAIQCMGLTNPKQVHKLMLDSLKVSSLPTKVQLEGGLQVLSEIDLRPQQGAAAHNIPCLRIFGALDSLIPKNVIPKIADLYPLDKIEVIHKASHAPFISHKEECAKLIIEFLNDRF